MSKLNWISYADKQPQEEGVYRWRLPLKASPEDHVSFLAWMREQLAGFERVTVPTFARWDGWRHVVPKETQWSALSEPVELGEFAYDGIAVDGVEFSPCPFCGSQPSLSGLARTYGGAFLVSADPSKYNAWTAECCKWAATPVYSDPTELVSDWNSALAPQKAL